MESPYKFRSALLRSIEADSPNEYGFRDPNRAYSVGIRRRRPEFTSRRATSLQVAFPEVRWDLIAPVLKNPGIWGDRPQYEIHGVAQIGDKSVEVFYTFRSPGGGSPKLEVWRNMKKVMHVRPAPLRDSKAIWERVVKVVESL